MIDAETLSMVGRNVEAVAVLEWAGYSNTPGTCLWENSDLDDMRCAKSDCSCAWSIDANWVTGTLVPALEAKELCEDFSVQVLKGSYRVFIEPTHVEGDTSGMGTGPTFEAAFLAAAAKAVGGQG